MQRRIIRLSTEDSSCYLDIEEGNKILCISAINPDKPSKRISFLLDDLLIKELLHAIDTLRPEMERKIK